MFHLFSVTFQTFFETSLTMQSRLSLNSLPSCLSLPNAVITGMCLYTQLFNINSIIRKKNLFRNGKDKDYRKNRLGPLLNVPIVLFTFTLPTQI